MNFVVETNNYGAVLIDKGHYAEASITLQQSLRKLLSLTDGSDEATCHSTTNINHARTKSQVPIKNRDCPSSSFIYQKSLRIACGEEIKASLASCAVLFNLALAKHMHALQVPCSSKKTTLISSASKLYKMAYETLPESERDDAKITAVTIALAVLNNLGQIYHEVGEYEISRIFLDDLSNLCISSKEDPQFEGIALDIDGLFLNTVLLRNPEFAAAA